MSEHSFFEHFIAKKRFHISSEHPERAVELLPWATVNQLIEFDILPPDKLRVMRSSIDVAPLMFRRQDGSKRLRAGALQGLLAQGVSLVVNDIDDAVPQIGRLADAIERRLSHKVGINAYLTFGQGSAFKAHWDEHDVLVVQVHGSKRWRSYGTPIPYPIEKHRRERIIPTKVVWENLMKPGDILYLPRGEIHDAAVEGNNSVHLTLGIDPLYGIDFVRWLATRAEDDELFRVDLSRLGGELRLRQHEIRLKERLHVLIDSTSLADYLDADDRERSPRVLLSIGQHDQLGKEMFVQPALRRNIDLSAYAENEATVTIGGEPYRLSAAAQRALRLLLERNGFNFGELATTLDSLESREIFRQGILELVQHGLAALRRLDPP